MPTISNWAIHWHKKLIIPVMWVISTLRSMVTKPNHQPDRIAGGNDGLHKIISDNLFVVLMNNKRWWIRRLCLVVLCPVLHHHILHIQHPCTSRPAVISVYLKERSLVKQESLANANVKRATAVHVWRHMTSIGTTVAKLWPFLYVQDGRQPPSWILSNRK